MKIRLSEDDERIVLTSPRGSLNMLIEPHEARLMCEIVAGLRNMSEETENIVYFQDLLARIYDIHGCPDQQSVSIN